MYVLVVYNPISGAGTGRLGADQVRDVLGGRGHAVDLVGSEREDASKWLAGRLAGVDAVVVVGGDGTVRSVAGAVAEAGVALLHVPGGNENLFARGFGMPGVGMAGDVDAVVATVERGARREVDVATANGETMLLMASVGLDAEIVAEVAARRGGSVSNWLYVRAAIACARRCAPPRCTVVVDGDEVVSGEAGWCVVANSREYGGRINPAPMAQMDDRVLDVVFFPASSSLGVLRWMSRCRRGRQVGHAGLVHHAAASDVEIVLDEPAVFQIDGDSGGAAVGRLKVSLWEKRLTVLVPPA